MTISYWRERCIAAYTALAYVDPSRYGGRHLQAQLRACRKINELGILREFAIRTETLLHRKKIH